jgi:hypothetical protein
LGQAFNGKANSISKRVASASKPLGSLLSV